MSDKGPKNLTRQELASMIAKREGKKSEVAIGDIREILSIIADIEAEAINSAYYEFESPCDLLHKVAKAKAQLKEL